MKCKKLLALLLTFCMVMTLVPTAALVTAADTLPNVELPAQGDRTNVLTTANLDNAWKHNTTISGGTVTIGSGGDWGKEAWQETCSYVASDVSALSGKDYVISWTQSMLGWPDDGPHLVTRVGNTDSGNLMLVTSSDKIYMNLGGTLTLITDADRTGSTTYAVYVRKEGTALTTLYIYANGSIVGSYAYGGAVVPIFGQSWKDYYWAGPCTITNLAMYDASPDVTLPSRNGQTNLLTDENLTNAWAFNTTISGGTVTIGSGGDWGKEAWQETCSYVASDVSALNGKDYVVKWTQSMLGWVDDGPHLVTRVGNTDSGHLMLVTTSDKVYMNLGGALTLISDDDHVSSATFAVYVKQVDSSLTNLYVFANGSLIGTFAYGGAVNPVFGQSWKDYYWAGPCTITNYEMYEAKDALPIAQVAMPNLSEADNALTVAYLNNAWCNDVTFNGGNVNFTIGAGGSWGSNAFNDYHACVGHNANGLVAGGSFAISWTQENPTGTDLRPAMSMRIGTTSQGVLHITASAAATALFIGQNGTLIPLDNGHKGTTSYCVYVRKETETGDSTVYVYVNGEQIGGMHFDELPNAYFGLSWNGFYFMDGVFTNVKMCEAPDSPALIDPSAPDEPRMPLNAYNYAIGAEGITVNTNHMYDDKNGFMQLQCSNWNTPAVTLLVDGITAGDDYAISYVNQKTDSWGKAATEITFGADGDATQTIVFAGGGGSSKYIDENNVEHDLGVLSASGTCEAGARFTIYLRKNTDATHDVIIFIKGKLKAAIHNVPALTPAFVLKSGYNNNDYGNSIYGLRIFKTNSSATSFESYQTASVVQTSGLTAPPSSGSPSTEEPEAPVVEPIIPTTEDPDDPYWNDSNLAMPTDAINYVNDTNLIATGNEPAIYYGGSLVLIPRKTFDTLYGNGQAKVMLSSVCSTSKAYAMSFWTHMSIGASNSAFYSVRFLSDAKGNYYEVHIRNDYVSVFRNGTEELKRFTLPSTNNGLLDSPINTVAGVWKQFMIYMKPSSTSGNVSVGFYINGEAMKDSSSNSRMDITANKYEMTFGTTSVDFTVRGLRFYKVNGHASSFQSEVDPDAEIHSAPNGVAGSNGGTGFLASMNPQDPISFNVLRLPLYDPSEGEPERSEDRPVKASGAPNFALGLTPELTNCGNTYNNTNGSINLVSANNWKEPIISFGIAGVNSDDDFVISFNMTRPSDVALNYPLKVTFGSDGNRTESFAFTTSRTTFYAADGTVQFLPALLENVADWPNGVLVTIHCYPDAHGTRTVDLFSNDTLLARLKNQTLLPFDFWMVGATDVHCPMNITNLSVYKFDDSVPSGDGPVIVGIKNGYQYQDDRYFTVYGNIQSVTINGTAVASIGNSTYLITTGTKGTYTVVATDTSNRSTTVTVTSNNRPRYVVSIQWANMYYRVTGCYDAGTLPYTGIQTFHAYEGETVTIIPEDTLETYGSVKRADSSWSWLSNGAYSFTATEDFSFVVQGFSNPVVTLVIEGNGTVNGISDGEYLLHNSDFTVTAVPAAGWAFDHWVWSDTNITANPKEFNVGLFPVTLTAVFVQAAPLYNVTVASAVGGTATGAATNLDYGTSVTLNATPNAGYSFKYWLINGRIYHDATVTLPVTSDIYATPVFSGQASSSYTINFFTADSRLVASYNSSYFDPDKDLPAVPARYGYTSSGWDYVWEDGINSDIDVYPQYIKDSTTYSISVVGGMASRSTAQFETVVTVMANSSVNFVGWKDANNEFVSTSFTYTFFAVQDVTLTAVYEGEQPAYFVNVLAKSKNQSTGSTKYTINVIGTTYVGTDYTLLERGIVYAEGAQTTSSLVIDGTGVKKRVSSTVANGQFMYTLNNAPKGTTITARTYMIIKNGSGDQITVYSGLCDCTFDA